MFREPSVLCACVCVCVCVKLLYVVCGVCLSGWLSFTPELCSGSVFKKFSFVNISSSLRDGFLSPSSFHCCLESLQTVSAELTVESSVQYYIDKRGHGDLFLWCPRGLRGWCF